MKTAIEFYRNGKQLLTTIAKDAKRTGGKDKAYIRTVINDSADDIIRSLIFFVCARKSARNNTPNFQTG